VIQLPTSPDARFLTLVALAGAIGGTLYSLRSFVMFVGNRTLIRSWLPLYFGMPVVGALLGQIFYVVLRAGLVSPSAPSTDVSPYGFTAIAGLGGLFAGQALEKLKDIFEVVFTPIPPNKDPVASLTVGAVSPTHAKVGDTITITGAGLSKVNRVTFFDNVTALPAAQQSDTNLKVIVPQGAVTGPIAVSDTSGEHAVSSSDFTVDPP